MTLEVLLIAILLIAVGTALAMRTLVVYHTSDVFFKDAYKVRLPEVLIFVIFVAALYFLSK